MPQLAGAAIPARLFRYFPQKHLREAAQDDRTDQDGETDPIPAVAAQRHDAETVQQSDERHQ